MIKLEHVTAGYGKHMVLQDLTASFAPGSFTSIIGKNGCGKSTLLKTVMGMVPLSGGVLTVDGQTLETLGRKELAKKVAYLPQGKVTPDMTVEQLVLHGRFPHLHYPRQYTKQDRDIAASAMEQVGLGDYARKPLGALSGGMRQNAYIAMALAQRTDTILLDEPTTYLDISHQLGLIRTLRRLARNGKCVVAVMHDLPIAMTFSDRILLMDQGQVVCSGEPAGIYGEKIIERIFGVALNRSENGRTYSYQYGAMV